MLQIYFCYHNKTKKWVVAFFTAEGHAEKHLRTLEFELPYHIGNFFSLKSGSWV